MRPIVSLTKKKKTNSFIETSRPAFSQSSTSAYRTIQIARGPLSALGNKTLFEGELFEGSIVSDSGDVVLLYAGGHDGYIKLLGGGFQATTGYPSVQAPSGAALYGYIKNRLYLSTGQGWTYLDSDKGVLGYKLPNTDSVSIGDGRYAFLFDAHMEIDGHLDLAGRLIEHPSSSSSSGGGDGISSVTATAPLAATSGDSPVISLGTSGVSAGDYTNANITVDAFGRVTEASDGSSSPNGAFGYALPSGKSVTIDEDRFGILDTHLELDGHLDVSGRMVDVSPVSLSGSGGISSVTATSPMQSSGGETPNISLAASGVTAGQYTNATVTVDAYGRVTDIAEGAAGGSAGVASVNDLTGDVAIAAGDNVTLTKSGQTLTIAANNATNNDGFGTLSSANGDVITWDATAVQKAHIAINGNNVIFTLSLPTNLNVGGIYSLVIDLSGSSALQFSSGYHWYGGVAPNVSTANKTNYVFAFVSDGTSMYGIELTS